MWTLKDEILVAQDPNIISQHTRARGKGFGKTVLVLYACHTRSTYGRQTGKEIPYMDYLRNHHLQASCGIAGKPV
jgi:hypothetical protein